MNSVEAVSSAALPAACQPRSCRSNHHRFQQHRGPVVKRSFSGAEGCTGPDSNRAASAIVVNGLQIFGLDGIDDGDGGVADSQDFTTTGFGSVAEIRFYELPGVTSRAVLSIDNIMVDAPVATAVPEPGSLLLLSSGLGVRSLRQVEDLVSRYEWAFEAGEARALSGLRSAPRQPSAVRSTPRWTGAARSVARALGRAAADEYFDRMMGQRKRLRTVSEDAMTAAKR